MSQNPEWVERERIRKRLIQEKNSEKYLLNRRKKLLPEPTRPEPEFCECCGKPPGGKYKHLCLDHDHKTGKFRGWLCHSCNLTLGKICDSIPVLENLIRYLL